MTEPSNCDRMLSDIREIEKIWKEDLKKPHGGGLDSETNQRLMSLRIMYNQICSNHTEQSKIDN